MWKNWNKYLQTDILLLKNACKQKLQAFFNNIDVKNIRTTKYLPATFTFSRLK